MSEKRADKSQMTILDALQRSVRIRGWCCVVMAAAAIAQVAIVGMGIILYG